MSKVKITWRDSDTPGVTKYEIERDDGVITTVLPGVQIFEDDGATPDSNHKYDITTFTATSQSTKEVEGDNMAYIQTQPVGQFILDQFPGAVEGFSYRKLSSTATASVRLVRDDDAEADLMLTETGSATLASLVSVGGTLGDWVGGSGNAWVTIDYNQAVPGNDHSQTDKTKMKLLVVNGAINTVNGLAGNLADGASDFETVFNNVIPLTEYQSLRDAGYFAVHAPTAIANNGANWQPAYILIELRNNIVTGMHAPLAFGVGGSKQSLGSSVNYTSGADLVLGNATLVAGTQYASSGHIEGDNWSLFLDNAADGNGALSGAGDRSLGVDLSTNSSLSRSKNAGDITGPNYYAGTIQERLLWPSSQAVNRAAITANQIAFYMS